MRKKFKLNSRMYDINGNPIMYRTDCCNGRILMSKQKRDCISKKVKLEGIVGNLKNAENQP